MKKFLFFTVLINLISCSKKESDFIGEYDFKVVKEIDVRSNIKLLYEGKNYKDNAKRFNYLSKGLILIYNNDQTNQIDGELRYLHGYATKPTISKKSKFKTKRFDFELNKFRILGDTLLFNLKDSGDRLMTGYILKKANDNSIGFENSFFDDTQEANPWYVNENKKYTSIIAFTKKDSLKVTEFYQNQIEANEKLLDKKDLMQKEKRLLKNSNTFIYKNFIKQ